MPDKIPFDYSLKHLLLVAGVSGCGKSTLINELSRGGAAPEILSALPGDIATWSRASSPKSRRLRHAPADPARKPRGQLLHYEITETFEDSRTDAAPKPALPLYSVEEDVALQSMLSAAEQIYVVIVRTPRKQLIRQLSDRSALIHLPVHVREKASRFAPIIERLEKALPNWMSANACRVMGRRWAHRSRIRERNERLCKLYSRDGALDAIHHHWETSLKKACGNRLQQPFLYVEPGPRTASRKTFRLAAGTRSATISSSAVNWALTLLPLVLSQPIFELLEIC
jgi:hypothetical protein